MLASFTSGQLISRTGRYKVFPVVGAILVLVGCILLTLLDADTSQDRGHARPDGGRRRHGHDVPDVRDRHPEPRCELADLGVATAAIQFFRSMGGSLAVAGLGALLTARLAGGLDHATHAVFVAIVPLAAVIVVLAVLLPEHELRTTHA